MAARRERVPGEPRREEPQRVEPRRGPAAGGAGGRGGGGGGGGGGAAAPPPPGGAAPPPLGSAASYALDVEQARHLLPLVEAGHAASLAEAAVRFAIGHPAVGTILVGMATPDQFLQSLAAVHKGPLPQAALDRLAELRSGRAG